MENKPQVVEQEQPSSRRSFFTWVGQVAAGASLAAIGLGLANPESVLAASKPSIKHGPNTPNCIPCPTGCQVTRCIQNGGGCPEYQVTYVVYHGGCAPCNPSQHTVCNGTCCIDSCIC